MIKILIVADETGWIFDRHANEIKKRLTEYDIQIVYRKHNIVELSKNFDIVYVMDPIPIKYPSKEKVIMGLRCQFLYEEHPQGAKGLYYYGFSGRCCSIHDNCSMMHVVNRNQFIAFKDIVEVPLIVARHGIDENVFDRNLYPRIEHHERKVVWAGRPSKNKGFEMVRNACRKLNIELIESSYAKRLSKEQMPSLYACGNIYVCMSKSEGLNNPLMEAGAMGLVPVSTRTGAADEMIMNGGNGFLIDRDEDSLINCLDRLKDEKLRNTMADRYYEQIMERWTWEKRICDFRYMFEKFIQEKI